MNFGSPVSQSMVKMVYSFLYIIGTTIFGFIATLLWILPSIKKKSVKELSENVIICNSMSPDLQTCCGSSFSRFYEISVSVCYMNLCLWVCIFKLRMHANWAHYHKCPQETFYDVVVVASLSGAHVSLNYDPP